MSISIVLSTTHFFSVSENLLLLRMKCRFFMFKCPFNPEYMQLKNLIYALYCLQPKKKCTIVCKQFGDVTHLIIFCCGHYHSKIVHPHSYEQIQSIWLSQINRIVEKLLGYAQYFKQFSPSTHSTHHFIPMLPKHKFSNFNEIVMEKNTPTTNILYAYGIDLGNGIS